MEKFGVADRKSSMNKKKEWKWIGKVKMRSMRSGN